MTKADKIYKVKCTYDMSSKNITFGMMPIRDPEMIHINSSPEAPPPRIRILDTRQREVETVRIGDRLNFRIEIPEDSKFLHCCTLGTINNYFVFNCSSLWHFCSLLRCHGQGCTHQLQNHWWRWLSHRSHNFPWLHRRWQRLAVNLWGFPLYWKLWCHLPVQCQILLGSLWASRLWMEHGIIWVAGQKTSSFGGKVGNK